MWLWLIIIRTAPINREANINLSPPNVARRFLPCSAESTRSQTFNLLLVEAHFYAAAEHKFPARLSSAKQKLPAAPTHCDVFKFIEILQSIYGFARKCAKRFSGIEETITETEIERGETLISI